MMELITKLKYSLIAILILGIAACQSGTGDLNNRQSSSDPFGAQIVVVDGIPGSIFGNLTDQYQIVVNVNEDLTPDGSQLSVQLNSKTLPTNHLGCLLGGNNFTSNGQAVLTLLTGLFIDSTPATTDDLPATVNVGVTVTKAGGEKESKKVSVSIFPVRMVAPADSDIAAPMAGSMDVVTKTLQFMTTGIPVGTIVQFELSDPSLGSLDTMMAPVQGALGSGQAVVEYTATNGEAGTEVVTATIILPDPVTIDPDCPSIPEADRTLQASVVLNQTTTVEPPTETICNDMIDNDMDGSTDCADSDCAGVVAGPMGQVCGAEMSATRCADQFDNDGDGFVDCADADCAGVDTPSGTCEFITEATCNDNFDNDADMNTDCADMDCDGKQGNMSGDLCEFGGETNCADGFDNDRNGDTDCEDTACAGMSCDAMGGTCMAGVCTMPATESICNDMMDNDSDGLTDCEDPDCAGKVGGPMGQLCGAENTPLACSDGFDNDADMLTDCEDPDCAGVMTPGGTCQFLTEATCTDNFDNDGDGDIDCADSDCDGKPGNMDGDICQTGGPETNCADGFDNDRNGDADCADSACEGMSCDNMGDICNMSGMCVPPA